MFSKISFAFVLTASLVASSYGSPTMNATDLAGRATCIPGAESCATTACCPGLFCSTTAPHASVPAYPAALDSSVDGRPPLAVLVLPLDAQAVLISLAALGSVARITLIIAESRLEHNIVFPIKHQSQISFAVTALTTVIGVTYLAGALFVTQKSAMHYYLHVLQTLTAAHDNVSSWGGLGSALVSVYRQISIPASITGTLSVAGYLACVSSFHITTPALFSMAGFNMSVPLPVQTLGLPQIADLNATGQFIGLIVSFLPWMRNLNNAQTLGLFNGTLYEALQTLKTDAGTQQVSATSFNLGGHYTALKLL
ncbi:hypothetical protein B0H13DRAFT_2653591 [Mycena leptocephala]|nr:hypothetical protein B0H13DRAFT_2653591 [Mycena leptocephala]